MEHSCRQLWLYRSPLLLIMVKKCCVIDCDNDLSSRGVSLFTVPQNCSIEWLVVINRGETWRPRKHTKICSEHFPACYIRGKKKLHLSENAVPLQLDENINNAANVQSG